MRTGFFCNFMLTVVTAFAVTGCNTITRLQQPSRIPVFVDSYSSPSVREHTADVPCVLNLLNCPKEGTVSVHRMSGSVTPGPTFPLREIVDAEMSSVVSSNFRKVLEYEQAKLELDVSVRKAQLDRDGKYLKFQFSAFFSLVNPHHADKAYFSNRYDITTVGEVSDERIVAECVYEAVQRCAYQFVHDVEMDTSLVSKIDEFTP